MKIFDKNNKVNFVDKNNVFVGYDMGQSCCEDANWFINTKKSKYLYDFRAEEKDEKGSQDFDVSSYVFDKKYFESGDGDLDGGGMVVFRLLADGKPDLFLHIYNSHNGYYGHGFEATIDGIKWQEGCL